MVAPKIAVIYYSTYGHVRTLAEHIAAEVKAAGAEVDLLQIPEILSEEVRGKLHAAPLGDHPVIKPDDLTKYDGFLLGAPTRYGRQPAAVSAFFDQTGGLWFAGKLRGKFAGLFTSSASQHGGQETTALTTLPFFAHHGIVYVPNGFAAPELSDNSEVVGGSAWGAAAVANGDGSRAVTEKEKSVATNQAQFFVKIVGQFVAGASALEKTAVTPVETAVAPTETVAAVETGEPVLGKALPVESAPYEVDAATPATTEQTKEVSVPSESATVAATPAVEEKKEEAAYVPTPASAAAPTPTPAAAAAPAASKTKQQKKKGIFSMCCGGNASNYEN